MRGRSELVSLRFAAQGGTSDTRDELLQLVGAQTTLLGRIVFAVLHGRRPIRRVPE